LLVNEEIPLKRNNAKTWGERY